MNRLPQQLRVTKFTSGNVQITDIANGRLIAEFVEDAALTLIQNETGGIDIADANGSRFTLYTENFNSYQLPELGPTLFDNTTAEAYVLLEGNFFNNLLNKGGGGGTTPSEIQNADFYLENPSAEIVSYPAPLPLDSVRYTTGCFTLEPAGIVCQIAGRYMFNIGLSIEGVNGNNRSGFNAFMLVNGANVTGNQKTIYVRREGYGGGDSFSATLEMEVGDVVTGELVRTTGNVNVSVVQLYASISSTDTSALEGPQGEIGPEGPQGPIGPQGPEGPVNTLWYTTAGQFTGTRKIFTDVQITDANGEVTFDWSVANFTDILHISTTAYTTAANPEDRVIATFTENISLTSGDATTIRGRVIVTLLLGTGATMRTSPNTLISVMVIGE